MRDSNTKADNGYEWRMVLVTSLAISFLAFDRLATGYLGPFLVHSLALSNTQLGSIYSIQAVAVALTGFAVGHLSDRSGKRVGLLVPLLLAAGVCAGFALFIDGYAMLLGLRLASGIALGGVSPIIQSIVTGQSTPSRLGRNIGVQTLLMFLISQMAGPLVLPRIAETWGWQAGFFASSLPFILLAAAVALLVREIPGTQSNGQGPAEPEALSSDARRTVWLCLVISACFMIWLVVHATFLPVYLVEQRGFTPTGAGNLLGTLGVAGAIGGLILPMVSDRLGRRNVLAGGLFLSVLVPLVVLLLPGQGIGLRAGLFIGWMAVGALPIYAVMIPGGAVPPSRIAVTVALIVGTGEIVGGVIAPLVAGTLADAFGMAAPFWSALGMAVLSFALSLLLPSRS